MAERELSQFRPWREILPVHPAAELLPPLTDNEVHELAERIKAHGVQVEILFFEELDGTVSLLDGRSRLDALALLGYRFTGTAGRLLLCWYPTIMETLELKHGYRYAKLNHNPYELALSLNITRRHLTAEQKREVIDKLLIEQTGWSNRRIAAAVGSSPMTVISRRQKGEAKGVIKKVAATEGHDRRVRTATPIRVGVKKVVTPEPRTIRIEGGPSRPLVPPETEAVLAAMPPLLYMDAENIDASAERFASHFGLEDTRRFVEALLRGPLAVKPETEAPAAPSKKKKLNGGGGTH